MTITPEREPTLTDVLEKIEQLSGKVNELSGEVTELSGEVKKFDERFSNYQQATQWVVQLAFGLIVSATIIVIVSNVLD
ncbi:MAG: hypothetical protein WBA13_19170 [Microcoleaceae cyanobacterium]